MKLRPSAPKKKLRATATRRVPQSRQMDEEEEPTMRLSSAFVIVLLLHFVAIGGIGAFESIKVHQRTGGDVLSSKKEEEAASRAVAEATEPKVAPGEILAAASRTTVPASAPASVKQTAAQTAPKKLVSTPAASQAHTAPAATVAPAGEGALRDSGAVHVVASGENPVNIARKHGVKYEDLLKLNKIDDPKRLQIGQKLHIPAKTK